MLPESMCLRGVLGEEGQVSKCDKMMHAAIVPNLTESLTKAFGVKEIIEHAKSSSTCNPRRLAALALQTCFGDPASMPSFLQACVEHFRFVTYSEALQLEGFEKVL